MIKSEDVIEISDSDTSNSSEDGEGENDDSYIVFCKNLTQDITEEILYELFLQCGPVENVMIPKNSNGSPKTFAFIKFVHKCSVSYCLQLLDRTKLFGQPIYLNTRTKSFKASTNLSSKTNGNSSYVMSENNLSTNNTNNLYMNNNIQTNPLNIIKRRSSLAVATARTALRTAFRSADIAEITAATVAEVIPKILSIQPTQILPHYPHYPRVFQQDFDQFSHFVRVINGVHNDPNFMYLPYM